jgi:hypothetical protein
VNHFRRNLHRGLARYKKNASPVSLPHAGQISAAQANAAHDVHFKKAKPVLVGNLLKSLRLKDPKVVDENLNVRELLYRRTNAIGIPKIRRQSLQFSLRMRRSNRLECLLNPISRPPVYDNLCPLARQSFCDGISNSCG